AVAARPLGEELPALFAQRPRLAGCLELVPRPENSPFRRLVEPIRVEHGALVVIAQQNQLGIHDQVDAFAGVRSVANHVAEAVNLGDPLRFDVGQHRLEGLQVAVNIADDRLHAGRLADDPRYEDGEKCALRRRLNLSLRLKYRPGIRNGKQRFDRGILEKKMRWVKQRARRTGPSRRSLDHLRDSTLLFTSTAAAPTNLPAFSETVFANSPL